MRRLGWAGLLGAFLGCTTSPGNGVDLQVVEALLYRPVAHVTMTLHAQGSGELQAVRFRGPDSLDIQVQRAFADGETFTLTWTVDTAFLAETYEVHLVGTDADGAAFEQVRTVRLVEVNGLQAAYARVTLTWTSRQVFGAAVPDSMLLLGDARSYPRAVQVRWMNADGYRRYLSGDTTGLFGDLTVLAPVILRDTVPPGSLYVVVEHTTITTDTTELRLALFPLP